MRVICALAVFVLLASGSGVVRRWSATSGGFWDDADSWLPRGVPQPDDRVVVACPSCSVYVRRGHAALSADLYLAGPDTRLVVSDGAQLRVARWSSVSADCSLRIEQGAVWRGAGDSGPSNASVRGTLEMHYGASVSLDLVEIEDAGALVVTYEGAEASRKASASPTVLDVIGSSEVSVVVPSRTRNGRQLSRAEHAMYVDEVALRLSLITGGATAIPGTGYWVSDSGQLVRENVVAVSAAVSVADEHVRGRVMELGRWLCCELRQEAVFVRINGIAYLLRH
eukprot:m51a1_g11062 hypothetical protein (282) ;mRNA; r:529215-530112